MSGHFTPCDARGLCGCPKTHFFILYAYLCRLIRTSNDHKKYYWMFLFRCSIYRVLAYFGADREFLGLRGIYSCRR